MTWLPSLFFLLVGIGIGYAIRWHFKDGSNDKQHLQRELAQAKFDLDQQRQEVADYFEQSRELMSQVSTSLDKANQFWNNSAQGLLGENKMAPLPSHPPQLEEHLETIEALPPNDYVKGSHGIINEPPKAANG
ncbi:YhcB family protein [Ferrimonas pelagia]|uniref:Z-ring associated protein G n=1 Tax=Ferrimonas pelagia TaxID=1177826 RepID=A0ABP9FGJ3_9GAMM